MSNETRPLEPMSDADWSAWSGMEPLEGDEAPWIAEIQGGTILAGRDDDGSTIVAVERPGASLVFQCGTAFQALRLAAALAQCAEVRIEES